MTKKEKRPFHAVTKAEARQFANCFFGNWAALVGRDDEEDKDSNGYLFKMGKVTFDVFPVYGDGTEHDVLTAQVCIDDFIVGTAQSDMGDISFDRYEKNEKKGKAGEINIFYTDGGSSQLFNGDQCFLLIAQNSEGRLKVEGKKVFAGTVEDKQAFFYGILCEISKSADRYDYLAIIKSLYESGDLPRYAEGGEQDD
ncbi:MAG: hypothetical protein IJB97_05420 [Clostridia bacterium]|nr:hypothetical protein [Clostridia bacterium]